MKQYQDLINYILENGVEKKDRTGTGTLSVFGYQMRFDLRKGFPLVTTKKTHLRSIIHELLWFLKGETNTQYLTDNGVTIWDEWALPEDEYAEYRMSNADRMAHAITEGLWVEGGSTLQAKLNHLGEKAGNEFLDSLGVPREERYVTRKKGDLGPVYGKQWRNWDCSSRRSMMQGTTESIDQIQNAIDLLKNDPDNRRIIVSAWNVADLDKMALAPCHAFFQFYSHELSAEKRLEWFKENVPMMKRLRNMVYSNSEELHKVMDENKVPRRVLSCQLYQRSCDTFLGLPFNIASYAMLIHMIAQQVNMIPGELIWTGGDTHLYSNHMDQVKELMTREPRKLPTLKIVRDVPSINDYTFHDFEVTGYDPHPAIKAPVAI